MEGSPCAKDSVVLVCVALQGFQATRPSGDCHVPLRPRRTIFTPFRCVAMSTGPTIQVFAAYFGEWDTPIACNVEQSMGHEMGKL